MVKETGAGEAYLVARYHTAEEPSIPALSHAAPQRTSPLLENVFHISPELPTINQMYFGVIYSIKGHH